MNAVATHRVHVDGLRRRKPRAVADLGIDTIKVPSGEITNLPLLRRMGAAGKPILLSTGMSTLDEVAAALAALEAAGASREAITILQCNTAYPTPPADANLRAMRTLGELRYAGRVFGSHRGHRSRHRGGRTRCGRDREAPHARSHATGA